MLAHIVVSASIDEHGKLGPVRGIETGEKLYAMVRRAEFPRITHFGMSADQGGLTNRDDPAHNWRDHLDGRASPRCLAVESLIDLIRGLHGDDYLCRDVKLEDFIGALRGENERFRPLAEGERAWLRDAMAARMGACGSSGYLLLTMPAGWGRIAFIIDVIERGQLGGARVLAWHFAHRSRRGVDNPHTQWDRVTMLAEQIEARLRLDLAMPLPERHRSSDRDPRRSVDSPDRAKEVLHQVIREAGNRLKQGQRILLCIDGLDEAFGAVGLYGGNSMVLPGLLPARGDLPPGIYVLLTSRPGSHLSHWLSDPGQVERIRLEENQGVTIWRENQLHDIRRFLGAEFDAAAEKHNVAPPDPALVERVSAACEYSFYVTAWYAGHMQKAASFEELANPPRPLPPGLDGILRRDWNDVGSGWRRDAERKRNALRALLGILSVTREVPSIDLLRELLRSETWSGFPKPCGAARADIELAIADLPRVGGFFDADLGRADVALDWARTGIPDWIEGPPTPTPGAKPPLLSADEIRNCHAVWLHACRRWQTLSDAPAKSAPAQLLRYALLWLPWHAVMAGQLNKAEDILRNYAGGVVAGLQQALTDPAFATDWPAAVPEGITTVLAAREAERPRVALKPNEYCRYLASCG